jgi:hypothetical protein
VSKGSVASGRVGRMGVSAGGRIGVMSGSRLGCERLTGLILILGAATDGTNGTYGRWPRRNANTPIRHNADTPSRAFHHGIAG